MGYHAKTLSARAERRAYRRKARPGMYVPTAEQLDAVLRSEGPGEAKAAARMWLRFPGTRSSNVLARANALTKRRANNRVARTSRKANR